MVSVRKKAMDVFGIPDLMLLDVSHDGEFLLAVSNKENVHQVYQIPVKTPDKWKALTSGEDRVLTGSLFKDDSRFLFPKAVGGSEKHDLFVYDFSKRKTSILQELDSIRIFETKWTPDNFILYDGSSPTAIGLWKYDFSDKSISSLYQTKQLAGMGPLNPKKPLVAWMEYREGSRTSTVMKTINYKTGKAIDTIFASGTSFDSPWVWDETGENLIFSTNAPGEPTLAVWNWKSKSVHYLRATEMGLALDYADVKWIPKTKEILYAAKKDGQTKLFREPIDASTPPVELPLMTGWVSAIRINKKTRRIFLTWSTFDTPTQIGEYLPESGKFKVLVKSKPKAMRKLSKGEFVHYPTFDKLSIPAFDIPPNDDAPELPGNPIIVLIHGGPSWEFSHDWMAMGPVIQAYAASGFRVFCPNIRGSTGYGREFLEANILDLGGADLKDVIAARDHLLKKYPHTKKILLTGASYGGFTTFLGMTKYPGRFDAGAAIVGITDWFEMHRQGDAVFKAFTEHFFGKPEENEALYKDRSAINFVEQLQEPLMIIHRANDSRCPVEPIYTFMGKAIALGKQVEIFVEHEAGHGHQKLDHLQQQYGKAIEFFLKQVKQKE